MNAKNGVRQYLERHAEPEAAIVNDVERRYEHVLVVPACRESEELLDGYVEAAAGADGRVLCILVVNASDGMTEETHRANEVLVERVRSRMSNGETLGDRPRAWIGDAGAFDVLLIDRSSAGHRIPKKQGVGLARRVGCDLALALWARGKVTSPSIDTTDADARLPRDYFSRRRDEVAWLRPFWHETSGDGPVDAATSLGEIQLRYYVLGLRHATSPYAFHTTGSLLGVRADAYAAVRGMPRRAAGEDFHLLAKLAKVGDIACLTGLPLRIRSRCSDRVPYGTGPRAREILEQERRGEATLFYHPRIFTVLHWWLDEVRAFCVHRSTAQLFGSVERSDPSFRSALVTELDRIDARTHLAEAARECSTPGSLSRRVHGWFDALRTLQLVHALRDSVLPSIRWTRALDEAPFIRVPSDRSLTEIRRSLARSEELTARRFGLARVAEDGNESLPG